MIVALSSYEEKEKQFEQEVLFWYVKHSSFEASK